MWCLWKRKRLSGDAANSMISLNSSSKCKNDGDVAKDYSRMRNENIGSERLSNVSMFPLQRGKRGWKRTLWGITHSTASKICNSQMSRDAGIYRENVILATVFSGCLETKQSQNSPPGPSNSQTVQHLPHKKRNFCILHWCNVCSD